MALSGPPAPAGPDAVPVLQVEGLRIALPAGADRAFVIDGASLRLEAGRTTCVVGESGSGKSVLALAVMGLLPPALRVLQGDVRLQGEPLLAAGPRRLRSLRGRAMGMVFQEPMTALNPVMRCGAQIAELLRTHTGLGAAGRREEVLRMLERCRLPEPARMLRSYPHQLSGGQRQRIVIAMAAILRPALLICDEPTTALDSDTQRQVLALIRELQAEQGMAVLFITHDMGVVERIADDVLVLQAGRVAESGGRDALLRQPQVAATRALLEAVPPLQPPPPRPAAEGPVLLAAEGLGKPFRWGRGLWRRAQQTCALQDAALALRGGETLGVVGESGSGKTTLARCLLRLLEPGSGRIRWGGHDVTALPEARLRPLRSQVQMVFQDPNRSLDPRRSVGDSMIEGAVNFGATPAQAMALVAGLMDRLQLPREGLLRRPAQFSGGQRQRLAIVRALACRPRVLVADEAVSALDVCVQAQILALLRRLQQELGLGLLFITHDLRVAAQLCDRLIVMQQGRIVEKGATASLYARPRHEATRRLLAAAGHGFGPV